MSPASATLYDLATDPREFHELGGDPRHAGERARLREALFDWVLRDHNRITMPDYKIAAYANGQQIRSGILIGYWDEMEPASARAEVAPG